MCGIVGYVGPAPGPGDPPRRPREARVPRLRLRRHLRCQGEDGLDAVRAVGNLAPPARRAVDARATTRPAAPVAVARAARHDRHRPHPLGHARPRLRGERPPALRHRRPRPRRRQRDRRELHGAQAGARSPTAPCSPPRPTPRSSRTCLAPPRRRRPRARPSGAPTRRLRGHYAFVAVAADEPGVIVAARKECPLVVGRGDGEQFLASAIPAFLAHTRHVQLIENDEIVVVTADDVALHARRRHAGRARDRARSTGAPRPPRRAATRRSCSRRSTSRPTRSPRRSPTARRAATASTSATSARSTTSSCAAAAASSSSPAAPPTTPGLIGRYAIEEWARVGVEMDVASEYRYRNPVIGPGDLVIGISQSGETADTLAAMRLARERGATVLALTNVMGSQATRDADGVLFTRSGPRGRRRRHQDVRRPGRGDVPARACGMAELRGTLAPERLRELVARAQADPALHRGAARSGVDGRGRAHRRRRTTAPDFFLYLGRHVGLPVRARGRAEAQGDLLHRDRRLRGRRDEARPDRAARRATRRSSCVATDSPVLEKVVSNMQEVRARGAHVIAVATEGNAEIAAHAEEVLRVPRDRLDAPAAARGDPAPAARLPDRAPARAQRGPAAQPGEDRHRRVGAAAATTSAPMPGSTASLRRSTTRSGGSDRDRARTARAGGRVRARRRRPHAAAGRPAGTALAALEAAIMPALLRSPCLVSFSGGRDSSAVLAVAARLARGAGLADPIPITIRVPAARGRANPNGRIVSSAT